MGSILSTDVNVMVTLDQQSLVMLLLVLLTVVIVYLVGAKLMK